MDHAANLTLVPFDLTKTVIFGRDRLEQLKQGDSPLGRWLFENIASWHAISTPFSLLLARRAGFMPHDPLAVGFLLWPELYETATENIRVITGGAHRGKTGRAKDGRRITYTSNVNEKEFLDRFVRRLQYQG
jgi:inosine-uridine nucleoside N-ribohydrolase